MALPGSTNHDLRYAAMRSSIEQVIRATSDRALQRALAKYGELGPDEAEMVLQRCKWPKGVLFAELAGATQVAPLLENPEFVSTPREVIGAWISALRSQPVRFNTKHVVEAIAAFAEREMLGGRELHRIVSIVSNLDDPKLFDARMELEHQVHRFHFTESHLYQIVKSRLAAFSPEVASRIAAHPSATVRVWRALLGPGYLNIRLLAELPGARKDPVIRESLEAMKWDPDIRLALCLDADGKEFLDHWLYLCQESEENAVRALEAATADQLRSLGCDRLVPLLQSPDREVRLAALTALGKVGEVVEGGGRRNAAMKGCCSGLAGPATP